MRHASAIRHRGATSAVLLVGGGAIAAATWVSGATVAAVGLVVFYVVAAATAFVWAGGRGDVAAIMRVEGDERQRGIDRDATAVTGLVMAAVAILGAVVGIARTGDPGAYGVILIVIRARR